MYIHLKYIFFKFIVSLFIYLKKYKYDIFSYKLYYANKLFEFRNGFQLHISAAVEEVKRNEMR